MGTSEKCVNIKDGHCKGPVTKLACLEMKAEAKGSKCLGSVRGGKSLSSRDYVSDGRQLFCFCWERGVLFK